MSSPMQSNGIAAIEFQTHFGAPPGSPDVRSDCEKWERLCAQLLQERERLLAELARTRAQNAADLRSLAAVLSENPEFNLSMEEVYAQVDRESSLETIIAEMEREAQKT
jgi:hypothetical protein